MARTATLAARNCTRWGLLLAGHEPASQQYAAKRLDVDRTTMVTVLDTLQAKGLVSRRPDSENRRRNVVPAA